MNEAATRVVISLSQEFHFPEAGRIIRQLEGATAGREVVLDFSACRQVDIAAASLLAQAIEREGGAVRVRGLTRQDCRLLAYLGVSFGADRVLDAEETGDGDDHR
jgi:MFS superfamily sulfate permease-like transporter